LLGHSTESRDLCGQELSAGGGAKLRLAHRRDTLELCLQTLQDLHWEEQEKISAPPGRIVPGIPLSLRAFLNLPSPEGESYVFPGVSTSPRRKLPHFSPTGSARGEPPGIACRESPSD